MRYIYIIGILLTIHTHGTGQSEVVEPERTAAVTIGIFQGGGSLIGGDFEKMLYKNLAVQAGVGIFGFGAGINYHFKPKVRSSFISIQYLKQGFGHYFVQNAVGSCFVYRANDWFTFQLGFARPLSRGPGFPKNLPKSDVILTYAIGLYLPL